MSQLARTLGPDALDPRFEAAFRLDTPSAWDATCERVGPDVWSFPFLSPPACARWLERIDALRAEEPPTRAPNSMHRYGVVLGALGFEPLLRELRTTWLAPLSGRLFADVAGDALDDQYGFLAEYGADGDDELGFHVDQSAVTLNLCLGDDEFTGSELYFRGRRCDLHRQSGTHAGEAFEVEHEVGVALLHAGRHRHGVHPLGRGRRRNLILWLQSGDPRAAGTPCQPWCGARG